MRKKLLAPQITIKQRLNSSTKAGEKEEEMATQILLIAINDQEYNNSFINQCQKNYLYKDILDIFMPQIEATKSEEVQAFLNQNGGIAVVDCFATWCGPCKAIAPYVHQQSSQTNIGLVKIDVDKSPELSSAYKVQAMPTFLVIQGSWNNVILNVVGGGQGNVNKVFQHALQHKK